MDSLLTILNGIPLLFHNKWKRNPKRMSKTGTEARDQPRGTPQLSGRFMEKLTRGRSMCSCVTWYRHQLKTDWKEKEGNVKKILLNTVS